MVGFIGYELSADSIYMPTSRTSNVLDRASNGFIKSSPDHPFPPPIVQLTPGCNQSENMAKRRTLGTRAVGTMLHARFSPLSYNTYVHPIAHACNKERREKIWNI